MSFYSPTLSNSPILSSDKQFAYELLAKEIREQIQAGVLRPGDRLLSVRQMCQQKQLSPATVRLAYQTLEGKGLIEVRPQSGYYVRLQPAKQQLTHPVKSSTQHIEPSTLRSQDLFHRIREDATREDLVQFGVTIPAPDLLPAARLNNLMARLARSGKVPLHLLGSAQGCRELRVQIARRAFLAGCHLSPDEVLVTNGCTEALNLALRAVCQPGDLVAIESPTYFGILQVIEALGLKVLEIPCHPHDGLDLDILQTSLGHFPVKAVVVVANFSNPLGSLMPDENKQKLVDMLASRQIPLIEDDLYGDLYFSERRPAVCRSFDRQGGVILCSSYSKVLTPAYRVGWMTCGRWMNEIERLKAAANLFSAALPQLTVAKYLESGGYDPLVRRMRRVYELKLQKMADLVLRYFPQGTRVTTPKGGFVLWVELPEPVDSLDLYHRGISFGISTAPGYLFASDRRYYNYVRLNAGMLSGENEWAIIKLGKIAEEQGGDSA
jgi:DNA-binding transcriptional MocR family regulator